MESMIYLYARSKRVFSPNTLLGHITINQLIKAKYENIFLRLTVQYLFLLKLFTNFPTQYNFKSQYST